MIPPKVTKYRVSVHKQIDRCHGEVKEARIRPARHSTVVDKKEKKKKLICAPHHRLIS